MNDRLLKESDVMRAIDKRVEELWDDPQFIRKKGYIDVLGIKKHILAIPSADPPKGKWIYPTDVVGFGRCNNCKALWDKSLIDNIFFKYCPRCGAYMKGIDDES